MALNTVMLIVIYAECRYAECHYAECHTARQSADVFAKSVTILLTVFG
jgi:hypothetical protein